MSEKILADAGMRVRFPLEGESSLPLWTPPRRARSRVPSNPERSLRPPVLSLPSAQFSLLVTQLLRSGEPCTP